MNAEQKRLQDLYQLQVPWQKWGPYLSERQWGTVREDYSRDGNAWAYFSHHEAHSRAYRWGEDGLAGISDDQQHLCFALALWNGRDRILKERLFGLTNSEGNHGEDVKEYYFYLDSTPTHSYMKYLYKYPQAAYPYDDLVEINRRRTPNDFEYELIDTGIFDDDRYFDVFVEYAKETPEDMLIAISVVNRGPETATVQVLPTLWFRNTWAGQEDAPRPQLRQVEGNPGVRVVQADSDVLGRRTLYADDEGALLFTENETNTERLFDQPNATPYVKDGIHQFVINGRAEAVNPAKTGTKVAAHYTLIIAPGKTKTIRLRLTDAAPNAYPNGNPFGAHFDELLQTRRAEADTFYQGITPANLSADAANVMRQALAGMLWSKQFYNYDVMQWLKEHGFTDRASLRQSSIRNKQWYHMVNADIILMPDKWEYPWYAAWDLAFHTVALAMVDPGFAKAQLSLMLNERYLHPNGQLPAYEWNFSDVNPPVHAWALLNIYTIEKEVQGQGDIDFLQDAFHKLMLNFTWWINRKDPDGNDVFGGGFLGLDNIGVFDRSAPLPTGGQLEQSDGTAWMAFYALSMLQIALELARHDPTYQSMASKFFEHFLWIHSAMDQIGERADELWDEDDGFFYDVRRILVRMLNEDEFLSPHGIRSISRIHKKQPYIFNVNGTEYRVDYLPAESNSSMFGGNSNWRGPVWFPMNFILIRGLIHLHAYYGNDFTVECPAGSGQQMTLWQVSQVIALRLASIFLRGKDGHRPVFGGTEKFQTDPHWRDHILFYEYFHGDNGAGLGANHQTGWTGLVARLLQIYGPATDFETAVSAAASHQKSYKSDMHPFYKKGAN